MNSKLRLPLILTFIVLILDQSLKIWVKTNMSINETFPLLGDWGFIHYIENPGMAFGYKFGGEVGKIILTLFRIAAVVLIAIYILKLSKKTESKSFIVCLSLILAGAIGNILDSTFYGLMFNSGTSYNSTLGIWQEYSGISKLNFEGYAPIFKGCVVDMFYFPIINGNFPDWFPIWGGERFTFFKPIFNVADSAITVGVAIILLFHKKDLQLSTNLVSNEVDKQQEV